MIEIYYCSKKINLKGYDCKFENNLRNAKLTLSDVDKISEFLKSDAGEDIEIGPGSSDDDSVSLNKVFKLIDAAGGLVMNENNDYLFIFRRGKWDLPKGKVDKGETIQDTAIREVKEECGLKKVKPVKFLRCTFHIYPIKEKFVLKTTYWYLMTASGNQTLVPQTEEDITEILWLSPDKLKKVLGNTFPSIDDVINFVF